MKILAIALVAVAPMMLTAEEAFTLYDLLPPAGRQAQRGDSAGRL